MSLVRPHLEALTAPDGPFAITVDVVHGHPVRTYVERPTNLRQFVAVAAGHGDREFLVQPGYRLTFEAAFDRSRRLATALAAEFDIQVGDRVAVVGSNTVDWVVCYWGVVACNAVVVPLNAWWRAEEIRFALDDSGTRVALADGRRARVLIEAGFPPHRTVVWGEEIPGTVPLDALLGGEPFDVHETPAAAEDDTAVIFYTSGTTGHPKGSANTHRNIVANFLNSVVFLRAAQAALGVEPDSSQEIDLCVVPLFHATANLAIMTPFAYAGHKLVFLPSGKFDPDIAGETIAAEGVTRFGGVPTIVARMLDAGVAERHDVSTVRSISYGGAPASPSLAGRTVAAFPGVRDRLTQGYGLTETSSLVTINAGPDYLTRPDSVGIAVPTCEIVVAGTDGAPLPAGAAGEIRIRGSNVIPGYWNRPEANADSFTDGFIHTGDIGYLDDDGFLYITDRAKDMVIRGGENVYCTEVEGVLDAHPGVAESAVVGSPDPDLGEVVKGIVVCRPGHSPSGADLHAHCAQHLAEFKIPTLWEFTDRPLPRNPAGKVLKDALRGSGSPFAVGGASDSAL